MRYFSIDIFVSVKTGELTLFGSAPAIGMVQTGDKWGIRPVRQVVLAKPDKKVYVSVYNANVDNELIKRIAGEYVAKYE